MANATNQPINTLVGETSPPPAIIADDPQEIRAQIEHTRAQMGRTVDEIQVRLSPEYIKQQTQDLIRTATVEKVEQMTQTAERKIKTWRSSALHTMKENPIPTALIGLGLGWLLLSDNKGSDNGDENYATYDYDRLRNNNMYASDPDRSRADYFGRQNETDTGMVDEARARAGEVVENAQEKIQNVASNVQQKAARTGEAVRENVGEVTSSAQQYVSETTEQAQRQARRQMRRAKSTFWQTMEENPLAIGVAAAAAGALMGMAIPSTAKENELMGERRDRLVQDASSTVQETLRKVQRVAETTTKTAVAEAKKEAEKQDLPLPGSSDFQKTTTG